MRIETLNDGTYRKVLTGLELSLLENTQQPVDDNDELNINQYILHQFELINNELVRLNNQLKLYAIDSTVIQNMYQQFGVQIIAINKVLNNTIPKDVLSNKGDILTFDDTKLVRLPVGDCGQYLTVDSDGFLKWGDITLDVIQPTKPRTVDTIITVNENEFVPVLDISEKGILSRISISEANNNYAIRITIDDEVYEPVITSINSRLRETEALADYLFHVYFLSNLKIEVASSVATELHISADYSIV